jgi:bifunctional non-homologous end joining protein LigD
VKKFAQLCARVLIAEYPKQMTMEVRKDKRRGRIFIDTLRNAFGQTAVAPYSVRAKEGAPIATPINWNELSHLKTSQHYSIKNIVRRLNAKGDVWKSIDKYACSLKLAYKKLQKLLDTVD